MAGQHSVGDEVPERYRPGHHREVARDSGPFWDYLDRFTVRLYLRDLILGEHDRLIACVIVGILFIGYGIGRLFVHPDWQSLGVAFVGCGVVLFCLVLPLILDLLFAWVGGLRGRRE